ncbi:MAG: GlsB/YeaQ/YmgE family stress response membrane protein [Alphaproteobacteria bacterium]
MDILSWIVVGLVAGLIAKLVMPGNDPGGIIMTVVIGVVGGVIGGFVGSALGFGGVDGINVGSIALAVGGAIVLLLAFRALRASRRSS